MPFFFKGWGHISHDSGMVRDKWKLVGNLGRLDTFKFPRPLSFSLAFITYHHLDTGLGLALILYINCIISLIPIIPFLFSYALYKLLPHSSLCVQERKSSDKTILSQCFPFSKKHRRHNSTVVDSPKTYSLHNNNKFIFFFFMKIKKEGNNKFIHGGQPKG